MLTCSIMSETELVKCPMLERIVDIAYCIELQMIANKEVKPTDEERHISDSEWEVCRKCEKQKCLTPDIVK